MGKKAAFGKWICSECGLVLETRAKRIQHHKQVHGYSLGHAWNKSKNKINSHALQTLSKSLQQYKMPSKLKRKRRLSLINRLKKLHGSIRVNYNVKSIPFFDKLSKERGWNLQHAENGGEFYTGIGYFVDAYDKQRNIVVEYDEPRHYIDVKNNILTEKDLNRQKEIIEHLHCEFWRYNETMNVLWKVEL